MLISKLGCIVIDTRAGNVCGGVKLVFRHSVYALLLLHNVTMTLDNGSCSWNELNCPQNHPELKWLLQTGYKTKSEFLFPVISFKNLLHIRKYVNGLVSSGGKSFKSMIFLIFYF